MQIPHYIFLLRPPSPFKPAECPPEEYCLCFAQCSFDLIHLSTWDTQRVKANKLAGFIRLTFIKKRTPHTYQQQRFFLHQHHTLDCDSLIARAGSCLYVFLSVTQPPNEWSFDLQKLICCSSCCHLKVLIQCIVCPLHWE